ncbi:MAG: copper resistance protein B [Proteobacteria bacterium]|nr:copper resistance protein B [Pseudomonadota bacterium]
MKSLRQTLRAFTLVPGIVFVSLFGMPAQAEKMDDNLFTLVKIDQLEYRKQDGNDLLVWEGQGRIGNDENKLTLKTEGEYVRNADEFENAEFQVLYQRMISDFFDAQIGVRHDIKPDPSRTFGVIGINGLAPQWFETDASFFVSHKGDTSLRLEAEYDILFTQRLVLEPSVEMNIAFSDDEKTGVGSGLSNVELGLRLRYEITREFAPYIGINWERKIGKTEDFASEEGADSNVFSLVAGLRIFF